MKITLLTGKTFDIRQALGLDIKVVKSPTAKRLTLRIDAKERVPVLTLPPRCSSARAIDFVEQHREWIKECLSKIPEPKTFEDGEKISILGREYTICHTPNARRGVYAENNILYVSGRVITDDTLHVFVVHSPSRRDGERFTRPHRLAVASRLCAAIDSVREVSAGAKIIVAGDFNDYSGAAQLDSISAHGMTDVTEAARGANGAKATYRFKGKWGSLDHIFLSRSLLYCFEWSRVNDLPFLVEEDEKYGGVKPRRTYNGYRYQRNGVSDHLPLVVRLRLR